MDKPILGILMLDSQFPRIVGDVGNPASYDFPVVIKSIPGATPDAIVRGDSAPFVDDFIAAGRTLVAQGCTGITTTCGFLARMRHVLADELGVPVAASSLEQAPQIAAMLPKGKHISILTISAATLSQAHLDAAGVPKGTPLKGVEDSSFAHSILNNKLTLNADAARVEMVTACQELITAHPDTGAILMECANMAPYAADITAATGRPVFSIMNYLNWFHASLLPARY